MTTQTNKQVKITTDANFNNNKIINAKIDANENDISGVTKVYDVKVNNESIVKDRIADIEFSEEGNNTWTYVYDDKIYVDFSGLGIIKQSFLMNNEESASWHDSHNVVFPYWIHVSVGTLILRNGQLLLLSDDYHIIAENKINILETISENDIITVINGLSVLSVVTGVTGDELYTGDYVDDSTLVFKNGILLSNGYDFTNSQGTITFETDLNSNDKIVLIRAVTGIPTIEIEANSYELSYGGPHDNLIFKNGLFMSLGLDYEIETIDFGQSQYKIHFYEELQEGDIVTMIYNEPYSIYTLLGDKQNKLPLYEPGKVLGTDGNRLMWVNAGGGTDDGIYHPRNGDELYDIFENEPGWARAIDFSNFDFSTFYEDGYIIDGKSFTFRNFSMGSNWVSRNFHWLKSPLFTLTNGAGLFCTNFTLDVGDIEYNPSDASNVAPLIRVLNGSIQITTGMMNIYNITGIDKYVAIQINDSDTQISNYSITVNGFDENRPDSVNSEVIGIEINGSSSANINSCHFMVFGAKSNYAVKYNDDVMNNLILSSVDIDISDTDYSIFTPNAFNLTLSNVNLPSIDCMEEPTFTQMQDNTDYFVNDFITINDKKLVATKDFNSHIYMNDIEQGYLDEVYEDFYTIKVRGKLYSVNDPNEVISSYENLDYGYRANGIILSSDNWNLPISDVHLQSDNAQDAIKELAARGTGANLYDIKLLSQAIADKGWAFTCKSTRQDLAKADVPTVYADILNKYNNADKDLVANENNTAYGVQYDSYSNKFIYKPTNQNKLYSSDLVDLSNPTDLNISSVNVFMLGQNINIVKGTNTLDGTSYYIYNKDWELIRTINLSTEYNNISAYRYVDGAFLFLVNDNDNFHQVCYLIKFEDNINVENPIISNNFKLLDGYYRGMNISDIIDNKIYITCAGDGNGWSSYFLEINFNDLSYINAYESNIPNNTYNNYANITKYDDKYYFGSITGVYQSSDLVNWTLIYSLASPCNYIEKINNIFYIICNGFIITTENFLNFNVIISFTGWSSNYSNNFVNCYVGNNTYIFNFKNPLYLYCLEAIKTYTDTYVIDGNTVEIDYCKNGSYKICIADSGTNDTNLATVYNYLGYYNYYRLDTTNETISLPRNSNLYSMMYVGDNYQDTLDGITGNATRLLAQAEIISDSSATVSLDVKGNKDYQLTNSALTSLTISTCEDSQLGTTIRFNSGSTATMLTDSASINWVGGSTPIPSANKTCLIFIWNKTGFYKEW